MNSDSGQGTIALIDYLAVLRRQVGLVVLIAILTVAVVMGVVLQRPSQYEAASTVLVQPLTLDPLSGLGGGDRLVDLDTERQLVTSTTVLSTLVSDGLVDDLDALRGNIRVETSEATQVLLVVATATDATRAPVLADAVAEAYLAQRGERADQAVGRALDAAQDRAAALQEQLGQITEELSGYDAQLSALPALTVDPDDDDAGESDAAADAELASDRDRLERQISDAQNRRAVLQAQLTSANTSVADLATLELEPGTIISPAVSTTEPIGPSIGLLLMLVSAFGLLAGVVAAFVRERIDGRVHDAGHVEELLGAPVLVTIPTTDGSKRRDEALSRLSVAIWSLQHDQEHGLQLALTSVDDFTGRGQFSLDTAHALSLNGDSVVVIDADGSTTGLATLVNSTDAPAEVADDRLGGPDASALSHLVRVSDSVSLLPYGARGAEARHPRNEQIRYGVEQSRGMVPLTLLHLAPITVSAEALEFQRWVDGSVVVVRLGRSRTADVRQAARDFALTGKRIAGVVVISGSSWRRHDQAGGQSAPDLPAGSAGEEGTTRSTSGIASPWTA